LKADEKARKSVATTVPLNLRKLLDDHPNLTLENLVYTLMKYIPTIYPYVKWQIGAVSASTNSNDFF